ncbi:hypothetical protein Ancab_002301 [Ancistrocladus abbreviatus]
MHLAPRAASNKLCYGAKGLLFTAQGRGKLKYNFEVFASKLQNDKPEAPRVNQLEKQLYNQHTSHVTVTHALSADIRFKVISTGDISLNNHVGIREFSNDASMQLFHFYDA